MAITGQPHYTVEQVIDAMGGVERVRGALADVAAGWAYIEAARDTLIERYPDEWIAVYRDRVVAHAPDGRSLDALLDANRVDRRSLVIHQVTATEPTFLLLM